MATVLSYWNLLLSQALETPPYITCCVETYQLVCALLPFPRLKTLALHCSLRTYQLNIASIRINAFFF